MKLETGMDFHGFRVTQVRVLPELEGELCELHHRSSGAQLVWLNRPETNKTFVITFKTLPEDDSGVFHILEHSVLCGSKSFPVKEPFVELLKSSMKTYLNAMTFPDKTVFPASSRNEKDFMNLLTVYLDSVFFPAIYENPNIFRQEGWRYALTDAADQPIYKGVVYNEMKGAYASVDNGLYNGMQSLLFPDNCYHFDCGGNPEAIVQLTPERFLEAHKRFYRPENARIFLDGQVPLDRVLPLLDKYLLAAANGDSENICDSGIVMQAPLPGRETIHYYGVAAEDASLGRPHFAMGRIVGSWKDKTKLLGLQVLFDYMSGSPNAPLDAAIAQNNLGQSVLFRLSDACAQPWMSLEIRNTAIAPGGQMKKAVIDLLGQLLEGGLDAQALAASINRLEFQYREAAEPRGLIYGMNALKAWLYGGDPALYLTWTDAFEELRRGLEEGYFECLLKDVLLDSEQMTVLWMLPRAAFDGEVKKREADGLTARCAGWDAAVMERIIQENRSLSQWQNEPDTAPQLATLPSLALEDICREPDILPTAVDEIDGVTVLRHPSTASGIAYLNMYFSLAELVWEELPQASLLTQLMGIFPTDQFDEAALQQEIKTHLGSLYCDIDVFSDRGNTRECRPYFIVHCSVFEGQLKAAVRLICEVLLHTVYDAQVQLRQLVQRSVEGLRQAIIMSGQKFALRRTLAHHSSESAVREYVNGYACYDWLMELSRTYDDQKSALLDGISKFKDEIFTTSHLTLGISGNVSDDHIHELLGAFPAGRTRAECSRITFDGPVKEGIVIPAAISSAVMGANLSVCGGAAHVGPLKVLANILSYDYLWSRIRVQGGAYKTGFMVNANGNAAFYSFRDPDVCYSLEVYRQAAAFVRGFCGTVSRLDRFIIGAVAETEPLQEPAARVSAAEGDYFRSQSICWRSRLRSQMLNTTKAELLDFCDMLENMVAMDTVCIVGFSAALKRCESEGLTLMTV